MLRRIERTQLRLGMYVQRIEGGWFASPFWRRTVLLDTPARLARLRDTPGPAVVIDDARGVGLDDPRAVAPLPRAASPGRTKGFGRRDEEADLALARATLAASREAVATLFGEARLGRPPALEAVTPLVDELTGAMLDNQDAMLKVCRIPSKSQRAYLHAISVSALMIALARQLRLGQETIRAAGVAGLLHDIGELTVDDAILQRPTTLSAEEEAALRLHPQAGHALLVGSGAMLPAALDVCLHHHERLDGAGYPFGLAGAALSLHAKMAAICDTYDTLTGGSPRAAAIAPAEALRRMAADDGAFDAVLLDQFIQAIGVYPVGLLVRLRTNRLALVAHVPADSHGRTRVKAFYAIPERAFLPVADVALSDSLKDDQIVSVERPDAWFACGWDALAEAVLERDSTDVGGAAKPWAA